MKGAFENTESPLVRCGLCGGAQRGHGGCCPPGDESRWTGRASISAAGLCEAVGWGKQRVVPGLQGVVLLPAWISVHRGGRLNPRAFSAV